MKNSFLSRIEIVLKELNIDVKKEKEELKYADPKVFQEMKDLKLYELFYGPERIEQTLSSPPKRR